MHSPTRRALLVFQSALHLQHCHRLRHACLHTIHLHWLLNNRTLEVKQDSNIRLY
jgi:hypothetical protein